MDDRADMTDQQLAEHVAYLGCATDGSIGDAEIDWCDDGHSGAGWYISCGEYPDEGAAFVSAKHEPFPALAALLSKQAERDQLADPQP